LLVLFLLWISERGWAKDAATVMVIVSVLAMIVAGKPVQAIDCQQFTVLQILGIIGLQPPYGF
jgi:hypothetical protein